MYPTAPASVHRHGGMLLASETPLASAHFPPPFSLSALHCLIDIHIELQVTSTSLSERAGSRLTALQLRGPARSRPSALILSSWLTGRKLSTFGTAVHSFSLLLLLPLTSSTPATPPCTTLRSPSSPRRSRSSVQRSRRPSRSPPLRPVDPSHSGIKHKTSAPA